MNELLDRIQEKVAVSAIPASAMRNQGAAGVVSAAREFLATLPLQGFAARESFVEALDDATNRLCRKLPKQACAWGTSRKAINLFLRDCFYNKFLHDAYGLGATKKLYEIPLDSIVAKALRDLSTGGSLSRWKGVIYLTRDQSKEYQEFARHIAIERGIDRVHLDTYLWPAFSRTK